MSEDQEFILYYREEIDPSPAKTPDSRHQREEVRRHSSLEVLFEDIVRDHRFQSLQDAVIEIESSEDEGFDTWHLSTVEMMSQLESWATEYADMMEEIMELGKSGDSKEKTGDNSEQ